MTRPIDPTEVISKLSPPLADAVQEDNLSLVVQPDKLFALVSYLNSEPSLAIDYLGDLTAVDYLEHIELIYRLVSLEKNQVLQVKVRLQGRDEPQVPSITPLLSGADFMEREVFDLMGVRFQNHPSLRHIMLWEGFPGHPLRKDYAP